MSLSKPRRSGYECSFTFEPLQCYECNYIIREAHTTDCCKRNFCKNCILKAQKHHSCRATRTLKIQFEHHPNKDLNEVLGNFIVSCTNKCDWKGHIKEHDHHLNIDPEDSKWLEGCKKTVVQCIFCKKEAEKRATLQKLLQKHLEIEDWEIVYDCTKQVCEKWKNVGDQLGISPTTIDSIEWRCNIPKGCQNCKNCEVCYRELSNCYRELLKKWINSKRDANWMKLINALRNQTVEFIHLSDRLERGKFLDMQVINHRRAYARVTEVVLCVCLLPR